MTKLILENESALFFGRNFANEGLFYFCFVLFCFVFLLPCRFKLGQLIMNLRNAILQ